jgi:hypothetical protein
MQGRGGVVPGRLLLVLALLAGLLVTGLAGASSPAGGADTPQATPQATAAAHARDIASVSSAAPSAPVLPLLHDTAPGHAAAVGAPVHATPPQPVGLGRPALLVGQLPRPPSSVATGRDPVAHPGRAPPAPTGT